MSMISNADGSWCSANDFDLDDPLNRTVWSLSAKLQQEIQPPVALRPVGSVGPQQAMLEPDEQLGLGWDEVLPWPLDLVGKDCQAPGAVLLYGSAYAGFIEGYSRRGAVMSLQGYLRAARAKDLGWRLFQQQFLNSVGRPGSRYYGPLFELLDEVGVAASRTIFSEMCPTSLVLRGDRKRRFDSSRQPDRERAPCYLKYVQHEQVRHWRLQRLRQAGAGVILAVGHLAEHTLLRELHELGASIVHVNRNAKRAWTPTNRERGSTGWVNVHALEPLTYWWETGRWWDVTIAGKSFRVLPIFHPAHRPRTGQPHDAGYAKTAVALRRALFAP